MIVDNDIKKYNKLRMLEMKGWEMENAPKVKNAGPWWLIPSIVGGAIGWVLIVSVIWKWAGV